VADTHVRTRARPALLARELDRLLAEVAGSVDNVVAHAYPTPESLHGLHREMRRLRHALVVWQRLLPRRDQELVRPLDRRLKRLARLVGRVRDRDVMIALLENGSLPPPSRRDARSIARWSARLRDDARTGRELLLVYLRSERDAHLFEGLRESVDFVPRKDAGTQLPRVLDAEQAERRDDVRSAHRRARRRPTSTRLHHLRIQVRRLRHLAEVRGRLGGRNGAIFPPATRRLQTRLGRLHDLDLVLGGLDTNLAASEWGKALKAERRRVRRSIRRSLKAVSWPKPAPREASHASAPPGRTRS
jgi:CHAD domain-containing protein